VSVERLRTLSAFIRSQAALTDERSPRPGPGEVRLNHEAALLCADALDEVIKLRVKGIVLDELLAQLAKRGIVT
jgi:hypothetical protein